MGRTTGNTENAAQTFYGRWATVYDALARYTPGLAGVRAEAADALGLRPGATVLDMGCGTGANFPHIRRRIGADGRLVGVDFTRPMLARARDGVRRAGWENVDLVQADAAAFEPREKVDAVLATFVMGMLADPGTVVDRWLDFLKPGGSLVLLDAAQSTRPYAWPVNQAFRALVVLSLPDKFRLDYRSAPWDLLDRRVADARDALARRTEVTIDREFALGTVRLTGGALR